MSTSLKQLATAAGVSEATASLAMNNRPGVSSETKKMVQRLAEEMNYIPSITAQNLSKKKSGLVGVAFPNLTNPTYSALVQMLEDELSNHGFNMIVASTHSDPERELKILERFVSFRVDGAIIYPCIIDNPNPGNLKLLMRYHIPFVFLGGFYPEIEAPCIMPDYYACTKRAINYLYEHGGRKFCLISGCRTISSNRLRFQAFQDELAEKSITFRTEDHYALPQSDYANAYQLFTTILDDGKKYDSVLAVNTMIGLAVYDSAVKHGLRVPKDISIVAGDSVMNPNVSLFSYPSLASLKLLIFVKNGYQ